MSSTTASPAKRPLIKLLIPSVVSGIVLGAVGALAVGLLVHKLVPDDFVGNGDATVVAASLGWALFFFIGIGAFNGIFRWAFASRDNTHDEELDLAGKDQGLWRYFRFTTDHKVVGMQYLAIVLALFFIGSMGAFMIRLEQSQPGAIFFN